MRLRQIQLYLKCLLSTFALLAIALPSEAAKRQGITTNRKKATPSSIKEFNSPNTLLGDAQTSSRADTQGKLLPLSANIPLGKLKWVDQELSFAVLRLESRFLQTQEIVISRNEKLELTGIFKPTKVRQGRSLGLTLLEGFPGVGDRVIRPGESYKELLEVYYLNDTDTSHLQASDSQESVDKSQNTDN